MKKDADFADGTHSANRCRNHVCCSCCVMFTLSQLHSSTCTGRLILRFEVTGEDILGRVLTRIPTTVRYLVVGSLVVPVCSI